MSILRFIIVRLKISLLGIVFYNKLVNRSNLKALAG